MIVAVSSHDSTGSRGGMVTRAVSMIVVVAAVVVVMIMRNAQSASAFCMLSGDDEVTTATAPILINSNDCSAFCPHDSP